MILSLYNSKTNKINCGSGKKLSKPKIQEESKGNIIKNIRNIFKVAKENNGIKENIESSFELENKVYYRLIKVGNFYSNN